MDKKKLEQIIDYSYNADILRKIFARYLKDLCDISRLNLKGEFKPHMLNKMQSIEALSAVFLDKDLFDKFLNNLPDTVRKVLFRLTWEGGHLDAALIEKEYSTPVIKKRDKHLRYYQGNVMDILNDYLIIPVRAQYGLYSNSVGSDYKYYFYLNPELSILFKKYLPKPRGYDLIFQDEIGDTGFFCKNNDEIVSHINLLASYIKNGNLYYSKNGKILKSSLSNMKKYCDIREFFDKENEKPEDKNLEYVKTRLIIDFLTNASLEEADSENPLTLVKELFSAFFQPENPAGFRSINLLSYLKGHFYYDREMEGLEKKFRQSIFGLLRKLKISQWISMDNLIKYVTYRDIPLNIVDKGVASRHLYYLKAYSSEYSSGHLKTGVHTSDYREVITIPLVKIYMFLCAAFGIVDIAYDYPRNPLYQEKSNLYLSVFDGLRYVRLTGLGEHILGLAKDYKIEIKEEETRLSLDDKRLIIDIDGSDKIKQMVLDKVGERINKRSYKVSYNSFLKDCNSYNDILKKINLFENQISQNPPGIWLEFLNEISKKANPIERDFDLLVYKIKNNPELIALVARDKILKKYILKAEGYHILIDKKNLHKVKKRLEQFGYFAF